MGRTQKVGTGGLRQSNDGHTHREFKLEPDRVYVVIVDGMAHTHKRFFRHQVQRDLPKESGDNACYSKEPTSLRFGLASTCLC